MFADKLEEFIKLIHQVIHVSFDGAIIRAADDLGAVKHEQGHVQFLGLNLEPFPVRVTDGIGAGNDIGTGDSALLQTDAQIHSADIGFAIGAQIP